MCYCSCNHANSKFWLLLPATEKKKNSTNLLALADNCTNHVGWSWNTWNRMSIRIVRHLNSFLRRRRVDKKHLKLTWKRIFHLLALFFAVLSSALFLFSSSFLWKLSSSSFWKPQTKGRCCNRLIFKAKCHFVTEVCFLKHWKSFFHVVKQQYCECS